MRKITLLILSILLLLFFINSAAQNKDVRMTGLALKPPLGWNSFDSYGVYLYQEAAYENLEAFVKKLKPHGYKYFVIDAGWYDEFKLIPGTKYPAEKHARIVAIDKYGRLEPSKTSFPRGIKPIIERAHELGIKFGLHMMRGIPRIAYEYDLPVKGTNYTARDIADTTSICTWNSQNYGVDMNKPGAQEYYNSVYQKLADWGVDFIKVDDLIPYPKELIGITRAIRHTGRPIVISLSPGGSTNLKDIPYYSGANMVRITADIWDDQESIEKSFTAWKRWEGIGHPGFWPDLDMIPFGNLQLMNPPEFQDKLIDQKLVGKGTKRYSQFTKAQMRTFITQRALASSPLMIGGDLASLEGYALELITNPDMIACDQNGYPAVLIKNENGLEMWGTSVPEIKIRGWIGIFNRTSEERTVQISKNYLEIKNYFFYAGRNSGRATIIPGPFSLEDIWNKKKYIMNNNKIDIKISPDDVLYLYYEEK